MLFPGQQSPEGTTRLDSSKTAGTIVKQTRLP